MAGCVSYALCCAVFRRVQLFATPWTAALQAPLSMGFPRQEHWSGVPLLSPGDLPGLGIKPASPALAGGFFTTSANWEAQSYQNISQRLYIVDDIIQGLPRWLSGKESTCQRRRRGSIPGSGRPPGVGNGNPLQYCCLGNPMDKGAWWAI